MYFSPHRLPRSQNNPNSGTRASQHFLFIVQQGLPLCSGLNLPPTRHELLSPISVTPQMVPSVCPGPWHGPPCLTMLRSPRGRAYFGWHWPWSAVAVATLNAFTAPRTRSAGSPNYPLLLKVVTGIWYTYTRTAHSSQLTHTYGRDTRARQRSAHTTVRTGVPVRSAPETTHTYTVSALSVRVRAQN